MFTLQFRVIYTRFTMELRLQFVTERAYLRASWVGGAQ